MYGKCDYKIMPQGNLCTSKINMKNYLEYYRNVAHNTAKKLLERTHLHF